jgi:hypothetical protein
VSFADELIVVDKSSTDGSATVAARFAGRVEVVPWSPTVEETRAYALSLCQHEWVLFLDDDEILSPGCEPFLRQAMASANVDILAIPQRHYILGVHDERAYYWPEAHHRMFRRGAIEFTPTVHGGVVLQSDRIAAVPSDSGVCTHHLSYTDVASWIERTNRYTDRPNRVRAAGDEGDPIGFAHNRIDYWVQRTTGQSPNGYPRAVALLRAIYDMVDRLKAWEEARGLDGRRLFRIEQDRLAAAMKQREDPDGGLHLADRPDASCPIDVAGAGDLVTVPGADPGTGLAADRNRHDALRPDALRPDALRHMEAQAALVHLRATEAELRERSEFARKTVVSLTEARAELACAHIALATTNATLAGTAASLADTRAALVAKNDELIVMTSRLLETARELEWLSGSARLFFRRYMPLLWRHLRRRAAVFRDL